MLAKKDLLDLQFIAARGMLVDFAAFLDRVERHPGDADYRHEALKQALPILLSDRPDKARGILEALSDSSSKVIPQATFQGAFGAPLPTEH